MTTASPAAHERLTQALGFLIDSGVAERPTRHVVDALLAGEEVLDVHCTVAADVDEDGNSVLEASLAILTPTRLMHLRPATAAEVTRVGPDGEVPQASYSLTHHCILSLRQLSNVRLNLLHPAPDPTPVSADELMAQSASGASVLPGEDVAWIDTVTLMAADGSAANYHLDDGEIEDHGDHSHLEARISPFAQIQLSASVDRDGLEATLDLLRFSGAVSARAGAA